MKSKSIKLLIFGCILTVIFSCQPKQEKQPNIVYIYTSQQSGSMMSSTGNKYIKTPAMDYIANNGIRFTKAYTTNSIRIPARMSMLTGRIPSYFKDENGNQVRGNVGAMNIPEISEDVKSTNIAAYLKQAGYDLIFGGKEHLPQTLSHKSLGFTHMTDDERDILVTDAANFIKKEHDKPFFMVLAPIIPHDICFSALRDFSDKEFVKSLREHSKTEMDALDKAMQLPKGISKEQFFAEYCPPLPLNFQPQEDEALAIGSLIESTSFRKRAREEYTEEQWRMHRWAYARLIEMADAQIQVVLDAIKESGQEENTLIIFTSDHGDMDASHKMEHKTVLYEETVNIPFVAMWKGHIPAGQVNNTNLISNGIDLLPTICDYAGIKSQADPRGKSLKPLFEGQEVEWRNTLGVEGGISRMVVTEDGYKYVRYDTAGIEERLMDLNKDPYEKTHFTQDTSYAKILSNLRKEFDEVWFPDLK